MIPIDPIHSVIFDMVLPDLLANWKGWLKFLFIESLIGWVIAGALLVELALVVFATIGILSLF